ncbi:class I SAM-dependent methyltransferase [Tomitella fengzijianii]|uniref:Transferase n=1 Tax=Tomitella fengzijianii TaxID=2597660 RepID=A0A516X0W9_9ACTN|nr:methyltransferase domain-containing protein [Tomitella fengzijianii]QDQ96657.1 transferase [Tomitella fengzijianii]
MWKPAGSTTTESAPAPRACRGCGGRALVTVLDLGSVPAADHFPPADGPLCAHDPLYPLAMTVCRKCGLAQLDADATAPEEPRGVEPQALRDQAHEAVRTLARDGWLDTRGTVREFASPHGGSWLGLLAGRGFCTHQSDPGTAAPADVVLDSFGMMHEADQRAAAARRRAATAPDGTLFLQFHSLGAIVAQGQWNALRHGHFAYYSLTALTELLAAVGMHVAQAWEFDLYGGTVLAAIRHGADPHGAPSVARILAAENAAAVADPGTLGLLQHSADDDAAALRALLHRLARAGRRVCAYGASSRSVAQLYRAGVDRTVLHAVADVSPAKRGRRMPGTDVPIIAPDELAAADPDRILLTVPDLLPELQRAYPALDGRWIVGGIGVHA